MLYNLVSWKFIIFYLFRKNNVVKLVVSLLFKYSSHALLSFYCVPKYEVVSSAPTPS